MISKGSKKGTVRFAIKPDRAGQVMLAGDFNNWQPVRMKKRKDGTFVSLVPLGPGTHEYKFVIDGEWVVDPDNGEWTLNQYGTVNSVARLEGA